MPKQVDNRKHTLMRIVKNYPQQRDFHLFDNWLRSFRRTRVEWSLTWTILVAGIALAVVIALIIGFWSIYEIEKHTGNELEEAIYPVEDWRLMDQYNEDTLLDLEKIDDRNLVLGTDGSGAMRFRTDADGGGVWRTYDSASTAGLLPDSSLHQLQFDGERIWYVGKSGSLSSSDADFDNWIMHRSGRGFVPYLNLGQELSCMEMARDSSFVVLGTRNHGVGIYDLQHRDWIKIQKELPSLHVKTLLLKGNFLWIGSEKGLSYLELDRENSLLRIRLHAVQSLPPHYQNLPVHRLLTDTAASGFGPIHCVVGTGAHLLKEGELIPWKVLAPLGNDELNDLPDQKATFSVFAVEGDSVWLALPSGDMVTYHPGRRRLLPRNQGLNNIYPRKLEILETGSNQAEFWLLDREGKIHTWADSLWLWKTQGITRIEDFVFSRKHPLAKMTDGSIQHFQKPLLSYVKDSIGQIIPNPLERPQNAYFLAGDFLPDFGPCELTESHVWIGLNRPLEGNVVARYLPTRRSWQNIRANNSQTFSRLKWMDQRMWGVKNNGEMGFFVNDGDEQSPVYQTQFGPSQLQTPLKNVLSVEKYVNNHWFLAEDGSGRKIVFSYQQGDRSINVQPSPSKGFIPRQVRNANERLYLWGRSNNQTSLRVLDGRKGWRELLPERDSFVQMLTVNQELFFRTHERRIQSLTGDSTFHYFMGGTGQLRWKKLLADRFGRIWGLDKYKSVFHYHRETGNWERFEENVTDISILPVGSELDQLYIAKSSELAIYELSQGRDIRKSTDSHNFGLSTVKAFVIDNEAGWVLTQSRQTREIYHKSSNKGDWEPIWGSSTENAPNDSNTLRQALWAGFHDGKLFFLSRSGLIYSYNLSEGTKFILAKNKQIQRNEIFVEKWKNLGLAINNNSIIQAVPGAIWWLANGQIHSLDLDDIKNPKTLSADPIDQPLWKTILIIAYLFVAVLFLWPFLEVIYHIIKEYKRRKKESKSEEVDDKKDTTQDHKAPTFLSLTSIREEMMSLQYRFLIISGLLFLLTFFIIHGWYQYRKDYDLRSVYSDVESFSIDGDVMIVKRKNDTRLWYFEVDGDEAKPSKQFWRTDYSEELIPFPHQYPQFGGSGNWKLDQDKESLHLSRKQTDGSFWTYHLSSEGFEEDMILDICTIEDQLLTLNVGGVTSFQVSSGFLTVPKLDWQRAILLPEDSGSLHSLAGEHYFLSNTGIPYQFSHQSAIMLEPTEMPVILDTAHSIWWKHSLLSASLNPNQFDQRQRRFRSDICLSLILDKENNGWCETPAGWRKIEVSSAFLQFSEPIGRRPELSSLRDTLNPSDGWQAVRKGSYQGVDQIHFIFDNGSVVNNPFRSHKKFPDEYVNDIHVQGETRWIATDYGLREEVNGNLRKIHLSKSRVLRVNVSQERIYCQTQSAVRAYNGNTWPTQQNYSSRIFPNVRNLHLPLDREETISIRLREHIRKNGTSSQLLSFDNQDRRFLMDQIQEMIGQEDSLWILSPVGVQSLVLDSTRILSHKQFFQNNDIQSIRKGEEGSIHARRSNGTSYRYSASNQWLQSDQNPFDVPISGSLSSILQWKKLFGSSSDSLQLLSGDRILQLIGGKLSLDYINDAIRSADHLFEASAAGIIQYSDEDEKWASNNHIPYPSDSLFNRINPTWQIHLQDNHLFYQEENKRYSCNWMQEKSWQSIQTSVFNFPRLTYNGYQWDVYHKQATSPTIGLQFFADSSQQLNAVGQFPFDHILGVYPSEKEVWTVHQNGFNAYQRNQVIQHNASQAMAFGYHPELIGGTIDLRSDSLGRYWIRIEHDRFWKSYLLELSSDSSKKVQISRPLAVHETSEHSPFLTGSLWQDLYEGKNVSIYPRADQTSFIVEREGDTLEYVETLPYVNQLVESQSFLWAQTPNHLYRINLSKIPTNAANPRDKTIKQLAILSEKNGYLLHWKAFLDQNLNKSDHWKELAEFDQIHSTIDFSIESLIGRLLEGDRLPDLNQEQEEQLINWLNDHAFDDGQWLGELGIQADQMGRYALARSLNEQATRYDSTNSLWQIRKQIYKTFDQLKQQPYSLRNWQFLASLLNGSQFYSFLNGTNDIISLITYNVQQLDSDSERMKRDIAVVLARIDLSFQSWFNSWVARLPKGSPEHEELYIYLDDHFGTRMSVGIEVEEPLVEDVQVFLDSTLVNNLDDIESWGRVANKFRANLQYSKANGCENIIRILTYEDQSIHLRESDKKEIVEVLDQIHNRPRVVDWLNNRIRIARIAGDPDWALLFHEIEKKLQNEN